MIRSVVGLLRLDPIVQSSSGVASGSCAYKLIPKRRPVIPGRARAAGPLLVDHQPGLFPERIASKTLARAGKCCVIVSTITDQASWS